MKNLIFFSFALVCLFGCIGKGDAGTATYGVRVHYVDSSGLDLFSYSNDGQNGYWMDSVRVYDLTNDVKGDLLDCYPNGCQFMTEEVLRTFICENPDITNRYSYTLIHLKDGVDDTIKVHINQDHLTLSTNNDAVWYNGVPKTYDTTANILIVK
jgi:hypothetical protein